MIARLQDGGQRSSDRGHPTGRGEGIFGALERGNAIFKHAHRRVAVERIDELILTCMLKPGFRGLRTLIDNALREKNRLGHFAILAAPGSRMHKFRAGVPIFRHGDASFPNKKPPPRSAGGADRVPDLFSGLFNVARNPVNKSPRYALATLPSLGRQDLSLFGKRTCYCAKTPQIACETSKDNQ